MPIPNVVKYGTTSQNSSIKKSNVILGVENVDFGPTSTTNYWNGITPPYQGYTIYSLPSGTTSPSIVCPSDDNSLLYWASAIKGSSVSSTNDALGYFASATTNSIAVNFDYPAIITSGLTLLVDFGYTPSYPKNGSLVYDLSGNLNNGTLINSPSLTGATLGGALYLNGTNQYVDFGNVLNYTTSNFSFSFWMIVDSLTTNTAGQGPTLFYKGNLSTNGYYCQVTTGGTLSFITNQSGANQTTSTAASAITTSTWYNISVVRSGTTVTLYLNGVNSNSVSGSHTNPATSSDGFAIGLYSGSTTYGKLLITNFMSYNRALSSTEVLSNYTNSNFRNSIIYTAGNFTLANYNPSQVIYPLNYSGQIYSSYSNGVGFDSQVRASKKDSNQRIVCGGVFSTYNSTNTPNPYVTRLTSNLALDSTFSGSTFYLDSQVYSIDVDSNDKIVVGGTMSTGILRLNTDGSLDNTFSMGTGFDFLYVFVVKVLSDGKILCGGNFNSYNGVSCTTGIVRLNSNGSLDTTFTGGTGVNGQVNTIQVESSGKYIIGGTFTSYSGVSYNRLVRLNSDGSIDNTYSVGTGFDAAVQTSLIDNNNNVYFGGTFTSYSGVSNNRIVKLNSLGSIDNSFVNSGFTFSLGTCLIYSIVFDSNNNLFIGGSFDKYGVTNCYGLTILTTTGQILSTFNPNPGLKNVSSSNQVIYSTLNYNSSLLLAFGSTFFNGYSANGIASLNYDGSYNEYFINNVSSTGAITITKTNNSVSLYLAGSFTLYGGNTYEQMVKIKQNGEVVSGWASSFFATTGAVYKAIQDSNNKSIYVGAFTYYGGSSLRCIARANENGTRDTSFILASGSGFVKSGGATAYDIKIDSNGKYIVVGDFTSYSGNTANNIARLNSNGSFDSTFPTSSAFNLYVRGVSLDSSQNIICVGNFTTYSGTSRNRIIRLDSTGKLDNTFSIGTGLNSLGNIVYIDSNSKIYVGGSFTSYSGITVNRIIRLNSDGSRDTSFDTGTGFNSSVNNIYVDVNNKIYIVGDFTTFNGTAKNRFVRLNYDGSLDQSFNQTSNLNGSGNQIILV